MNEDYYPVTGPDYFEGPENTVHTILYLSGSEEVLQKATELISSHQSYESPTGVQKFFVKQLIDGRDGNSIWFDILMDNFIPQIYKKLNMIDGLEPIVFAFYCDYDTLLYTNDTKGIITSRRELFGIPADLEVEKIDNYFDAFDLASTNYKERD